MPSIDACKESVNTANPSHGRRAAPPTPLTGEIERLANQASYLVAMVARKYVGLGLPFDDLVSAGNVGLVKATYKFDQSKGVQFGTYAVFWIRKEIAEAVDNERYLIRVPRYAMDLRRRVLGQTSGRAGLSAVQIERGSQVFAAVESIHGTWDEEGGLSLEERLADPAGSGPSELVLQAESLQAIRGALESLSPREREVIALRYGIADQEPLTLRQTADRMGLSRERVRQIQQDALDGLRAALAPLTFEPRAAKPRRPRSQSPRPRREL